jgi:hypothetical protein
MENISAFAKNIHNMLKSLNHNSAMLNQLSQSNYALALTAIDVEANQFFPLTQRNHMIRQGRESIDDCSGQSGMFGLTFVLEYFCSVFKLHNLKSILASINKNAQLLEFLEFIPTEDLGKQFYYLTNSDLCNDNNRYFSIRVQTQVGHIIFPTVCVFETSKNDNKHLSERLAQTISRGTSTAIYRENGFESVDGAITTPGEVKEISHECFTNMKLCLIDSYDDYSLTGVDDENVALYLQNLKLIA